MTDQVIATPRTQSINKHIRKLPPEPTRWLLELSKYEPTPEMVTVMEVGDQDFGVVVMSPGTWRAIREALNTAHSDRYRALFTDQNGVEKGDEHGD